MQLNVGDHMVRVEHEQSDRMRGLTPPPADHWTPYAREFKADPRRSGNALLDHLRSRVDPGQTVIDVGAGGGSLALPLALHCQRVVAVEPSPSMCLVLKETASEFNVPNVDVVESDWMNAVVDRAGVTLCSHVVYVIREIGAFVRKLEGPGLQLGVGGLTPGLPAVPALSSLGNGTPGNASYSPQFAGVSRCAGRAGGPSRRHRHAVPANPGIRQHG